MVIGIGLLVAAQPRCAALSSSLTHTRYGKVARQWHVALVVSHTDTGRGKAMEMVQDQTFTATDGATIGYQTLGTGPSLILVPGVLSRACDYRAFAKALAGSFTVHTIERRGRGRSSPQNSDYCIETERLDVCALQKITQSRYIFGHSFGGLIALEAARNNASLIRAAVYEPGISVDGSISLTWSAEYKRLLTQGKRLGACPRIEFC